MKLTYKELLDAQRQLTTLLQLKPAPTARLAAQIARNTRMVEQSLRDFNTARDVLIAPYMVDGKFGVEEETALDPDVKQALDAEYIELVETEVDVDVHPLKMTDIEAVEKSKPGFEIPTAIFYVLSWMFED